MFSDPGLFEGDMVLSKEQLRQILGKGIDSAGHFAASKRRPWPIPVPYDMDPSIGLIFCNFFTIFKTTSPFRKP